MHAETNFGDGSVAEFLLAENLAVLNELKSGIRTVLDRVVFKSKYHLILVLWTTVQCSLCCVSVCLGFVSFWDVDWYLCT